MNGSYKPSAGAAWKEKDKAKDDEGLALIRDYSRHTISPSTAPADTDALRSAEAKHLKSLPLALAEGGDRTALDAGVGVNANGDASVESAGCNWWVQFVRFAFLATGVWWGLGLQLMVYAGVAARPTAQLPTLDWYGGMLLSLLPGRFLAVRYDHAHPSCTCSAGCLPGQPRLPPWGPMFRNPDVVMASVCDFVGTITTAVGLTMTGSAIFGIIFSSVSSWAALLRWVILGERLKAVQLLGVITVTAGLVISAAGEDTSSASGKRVVVGILITLFGTVAYGLEYVLCERALVRGDGLNPVDFLWYMGLWGTLLTGAYIAVYTAPRWEDLVARPTAEAGAPTAWVFFLFASHTVNNWVHNITWFIICQIEGSVSTGLLQGLKAIMLFAASSLAFCGRQESQCLTAAKLAATVVVVAGTLVYYSVPSVAAAGPGAGSANSAVAAGDEEAPGHLARSRSGKQYNGLATELTAVPEADGTAGVEAVRNGGACAAPIVVEDAGAPRGGAGMESGAIGK